LGQDRGGILFEGASPRQLVSGLLLFFCLLTATFGPTAKAESASDSRPNLGEQAALPPAKEHGVLLELFTSEGCSSCPPADKLLARWSEQGQVDGIPVIGLEWHVDYWNYLGWSDPFSSESFTKRQEEYARALASGRVYTPQLVIAGRAETVGASESRARLLIAEISHSSPSGQAASSSPVRIELGRNGDNLLISVQKGLPTGEQNRGKEEGGSELWLVLTETGLHTSVPRGENAGQTLAHGPVVRYARKLGALPATFPRTPFQTTAPLLIDKHWRREMLSAVVFLQALSNHGIPGSILAATALPLSH
jgi:hypothetical protein